MSDASADMAGAEANAPVVCGARGEDAPRGQSEVMDTLLLMSTKDAEIES